MPAVAKRRAETLARARRGQPSKYRPEYCQVALEAAAQGLSLTALAGMIEVDRTTLMEWAATHPDFSIALEKYKGIRTLRLERDLLKFDNGAQVTARIFALKNAAPDEWRDKQHTEITATITLGDLVGEVLLMRGSKRIEAPTIEGEVERA